MQYLLTEEEYRAIAERRIATKRETDAVIQGLCTRVADHEPIKRPWAPNDEPSPWGCILTKGKDGRDNCGYCDECPVQKVCPYPHKEWSK